MYMLFKHEFSVSGGVGFMHIPELEQKDSASRRMKIRVAAILVLSWYFTADDEAM